MGEKPNEPECCRCGALATVERNCPQVNDTWEPLCSSCDDDEQQTTDEIAEFEMRVHGGMYGVPSRTTRPIARSNSELRRLQRARARNLVERLRTMVVALAWRLSERRRTGRFVTASRAVRLTERANRIEAKYLKEGT